VDALKEPKNVNKHARVQLYPYAHPIPIFGGLRILHVRSDCRHNETCQISSESVQGFFLEPQGAENDPPQLTWHIILTTVYALMCYTVIICRKLTLT